MEGALGVYDRQSSATGVQGPAKRREEMGTVRRVERRVGKRVGMQVERQEERRVERRASCGMRVGRRVKTRMERCAAKMIMRLRIIFQKQTCTSRSSIEGLLT